MTGFLAYLIRTYEILKLYRFHLSPESGRASKIRNARLRTEASTGEKYKLPALDNKLVECWRHLPGGSLKKKLILKLYAPNAPAD